MVEALEERTMPAGSLAAAERWAKGEEPHPAYPKKTARMWLDHWWNKADEETRQEFLESIKDWRAAND